MKKVFEKTKGLTDAKTHYCPGCTHGIIHRIIAETLEEMELLGKTIGVTPVGCAGFCERYFNCDMVGAAHGRASAVATGIKRARPDRIVFTYQGDGDLASIGSAEALHSAARGERITVIFVNNAIYGMTGGQMAPTTLPEQKTSTSPFGRSIEKAGFPLDMPRILAEIDGSAYIASGSIDSPKNILQAKKYIKKAFETQLSNKGFSFVSLLSTCPTNWGMSPRDSINWLKENMVPYYTLGELKSWE